MNVTLLNRSLMASRMSLLTARPFASVAHNTKSQFEEAYNTRMEGLKRVPNKV